MPLAALLWAAPASLLGGAPAIADDDIARRLGALKALVRPAEARRVATSKPSLQGCPLWIIKDHLRATKSRSPSFNDLEPVTQGFQFRQHVGAYPVLDRNREAGGRTEARRLNCLLRCHAEQQHIVGDL